MQLLFIYVVLVKLFMQYAVVGTQQLQHILIGIKLVEKVEAVFT